MVIYSFPYIFFNIQKQTSNLALPVAAGGAFYLFSAIFASILPSHAFGAPVSQVFFGGASAFAMTENGRMLLENVMDGVYPIIETSLKAAAENARTRMADHTAPYQGTARGLAPGQAAAPAGTP